jgi:hypothetical protein
MEEVYLATLNIRTKEMFKNIMYYIGHMIVVKVYRTGVTPYLYFSNIEHLYTTCH